MTLDEINSFYEYINKVNAENRVRTDKQDLEDAIEDLLILAYMNGVEAVNKMLDAAIKADELDAARSVFAEIKGKTFVDRVREYAETEDVEAIRRVVDTETHRVYNEASMYAARKAGAKEKTWVTMLDEKVRDTHDYLESMTIPIEDRFYTFDGDSADAPGGFENAENNCGCRCELEFS